MADDTSTVAGRMEAMRRSTHAYIDELLKDNPAEAARRKAAFDAEFNESLAGAQSYEGRRSDFLKGGQS